MCVGKIYYWLYDDEDFVKVCVVMLVLEMLVEVVGLLE